MQVGASPALAYKEFDGAKNIRKSETRAKQNGGFQNALKLRKETDASESKNSLTTFRKKDDHKLLKQAMVKDAVSKEEVVEAEIVEPEVTKAKEAEQCSQEMSEDKLQNLELIDKELAELKAELGVDEQSLKNEADSKNIEAEIATLLAKGNIIIEQPLPEDEIEALPVLPKTDGDSEQLEPIALIENLLQQTAITPNQTEASVAIETLEQLQSGGDVPAVVTELAQDLEQIVVNYQSAQTLLPDSAKENLQAEQTASNTSDANIELPAEFVAKLEDVVGGAKAAADNSAVKIDKLPTQLSELLDQLNGEIENRSEEKQQAIIPADLLRKPANKLIKNDVNPEFLNIALETDKASLEEATAVVRQKISDANSMLRDNIFTQVQKAMEKAPLASEQSEMIIKLKPEELGKVELKIEVHNDNVIAKFDVASQLVKQALEANLEDLRSALKDKGFNDLSFDVNVDQGQKQDQGQQQNIYRRRIDFDLSAEEGSENYLRSLSALVDESSFEHLA